LGLRGGSSGDPFVLHIYFGTTRRLLGRSPCTAYVFWNYEFLGRSPYTAYLFWDYEAVLREIPLYCIFTLGLRGGTSGDPLAYLLLGLRDGISGDPLLSIYFWDYEAVTREIPLYIYFGTTRRLLGRSPCTAYVFWDNEAVPREIPLYCTFILGLRGDSSGDPLVLHIYLGTMRWYLGRSPCIFTFGTTRRYLGRSPIEHLLLGLQNGISGAPLLFTSFCCVVLSSVISLYHYILRHTFSIISSRA